MQKSLCAHVNMPGTRHFLQEDNYNAFYDFRMKDHLQRSRIIKTYNARFFDLYDACVDEADWAEEEEDNHADPQVNEAPALASVPAAAAAEKKGEDWVFDSEEDCFVKKKSVRVSPSSNACVLMSKCMCPHVFMCVSSRKNTCALMHNCVLTLTGVNGSWCWCGGCYWCCSCCDTTKEGGKTQARDW